MSPSRDQAILLIRTLAPTLGLDANLVIRQCDTESNFRQEAVSSRGAVGLMQLMPKTAEMLRVDPRKWTQNIAGGMKYLAALQNEFGGDTAKALAAYNCGPTRLKRVIGEHGERWRGKIPQETKDYLDKILA